MIQQLLQDPPAMVVLGFYLVAALFAILGLIWILRDERARHDELDCDKVHQEMQTRRAAAAKAYREAEQARAKREQQLNQKSNLRELGTPLRPVILGVPTVATRSPKPNT